MTQDPYCYRGTEILINKLNIRDQMALNEKEADYFSFRLFLLQEKPLLGNFDYAHLQSIHKYLFQDIYKWAGETRKISMTKYYSEINRIGTFAAPAYIESSINHILDKLKEESYLRNYRRISDFAERLAYYMSEINAIHPFREGNGRAQREFFRCLAMESGFILDWSRVDHQEFTNSRVLSIMDNTHLTKMIKRCLVAGQKTKKEMFKNVGV